MNSQLLVTSRISSCRKRGVSSRGVDSGSRHDRNRDNRQTLECVNGRGRFGGQTAGGHPKVFPRPRRPLFAAPALRELESACRVSIL